MLITLPYCHSQRVSVACACVAYLMSTNMYIIINIRTHTKPKTSQTIHKTIPLLDTPDILYTTRQDSDASTCPTTNSLSPRIGLFLSIIKHAIYVARPFTILYAIVSAHRSLLTPKPSLFIYNRISFCTYRHICIIIYNREFGFS